MRGAFAFPQHHVSYTLEGMFEKTGDISLICRASKYGSGKSSEAIRPLLKTRGKFKAIPIAQNWSGHRNSQRGFARRHNHREHNRGITVRRRINFSKRIVPYVDR